MAEMTYQDANGETLSAARHPAVASAYLIGIQPDGWVASKDGAQVHRGGAGCASKPVAERRWRWTSSSACQYSHRRRLIGGFYA
jgi:hypothetical protein